MERMKLSRRKKCFGAWVVLSIGACGSGRVPRVLPPNLADTVITCGYSVGIVEGHCGYCGGIVWVLCGLLTNIIKSV